MHTQAVNLISFFVNGSGQLMRRYGINYESPIEFSLIKRQIAKRGKTKRLLRMGDDPLDFISPDIVITPYDLIGKSLVNVKALNKLVEVLLNVKDKHFDLDYFVQVNEEYSSYVKNMSFDFMAQAALPDPEKFVAECGTTACACGHAGLNKWFIKHNFRYDIRTNEPVLDIKPSDKRQDVNGRTTLFGFDAIEHFFGLSPQQATWLFLSQGATYSKRNHVIARIQMLIKEIESCKIYQEMLKD